MDVSKDYLKESVTGIESFNKLRFKIVFMTGFIGLVLIAFPLLKKMRTTEKKLLIEIKKYELIGDVEKLFSKIKFYNKYVNKEWNISWWMEYLANGVKDNDLLLNSYIPKKIAARNEEDGFEEFIVNIDLEGRYYNIAKFVAWIESNKYEMKVSNLELIKKDNDNILAKIVVDIIVWK